MVKKEDLLKIFFIYLCLCHVVPGHPCGNNPLRRFRPLSRMLGKDINSLLNLLRDSNPTLYRQVQREWRLYADCVGLVDTGYFKRSGAQAQVAVQVPDRVPVQASERGDVENVLSTNVKTSQRARRLMDLLDMVVANGKSPVKDELVLMKSDCLSNNLN